MNDGYYLAVYAHISELAHIYQIDLRHDQHMVLFEKQGSKVTICKYWEFERFSGIKHHNLSFYNAEHAKKVIDDLLAPLGLCLEDMQDVFGTDVIDTTSRYYPENSSALPYHSIAHLFSGLMMDTGKFYSEDIVALAVDGGPDNVIDKTAREKDFYVGAVSRKGQVELFSIPSPGIYWILMKLRYGMEEGSLMALAEACEYHCTVPLKSLTADMPIMKRMQDIPAVAKWFENLADYIDTLTEKDDREHLSGWDSRFSNEENKMSVIAKIVQDLSTEMMENTVREILTKYELDPAHCCLALSGGFSLNCPTNTRLMDLFGFKELFAPPCISDTGMGLGMGLFAFSRQIEKVDFCLENAFYGEPATFCEEEIYGKYSPFIEEISPFDLAVAVQDVAREPIVWVSGSAEIGPRALGARSVLANPALPAHKDRLNEIKKRQWWRPVAPIVMNEFMADWFVESCPTPYMLTTIHVHEHKDQEIPAVLHLNGTARVQSIRSDDNEQLYSLIERFYSLTGIPMLCNTSLNDRGEPIINTCSQAINFALRKGMDLLYLGGFRVKLKNHSQFGVATPEKRSSIFSCYLSLQEKESAIHKFNPHDLAREEIEFYLNSPELHDYDLTNKTHVETLKKIIKKVNSKSNIQLMKLAK